MPSTLPWIYVTALLAGATASAPGAANEREPSERRVGRFTLERLDDAPVRSPLDARAMTPVPESASTLGDAARWLLEPTGYRVATPTGSDATMRDLLALAFPANHRHTAGMTVRHALRVIAGPAHRLLVNDVQRWVAFGLADAPTTIEPRATSTNVARGVCVAPPPAVSVNGDRIVTQGGDTLGAIAQRWQPSGVSLARVLVALRDRHPEAFVDGNVHALRRGATLERPTEAALRTRTDTEAKRIVGQQWMAFEAGTVR